MDKKYMLAAAAFVMAAILFTFAGCAADDSSADSSAADAGDHAALEKMIEDTVAYLIGNGYLEELEIRITNDSDGKNELDVIVTYGDCSKKFDMPRYMAVSPSSMIKQVRTIALQICEDIIESAEDLADDQSVLGATYKPVIDVSSGAFGVLGEVIYWGVAQNFSVRDFGYITDTYQWYSSDALDAFNSFGKVSRGYVNDELLMFRDYAMTTPVGILFRDAVNNFAYVSSDGDTNSLWIGNNDQDGMFIEEQSLVISDQHGLTTISAEDMGMSYHRQSQLSNVYTYDASTLNFADSPEFDRYFSDIGKIYTLGNFDEGGIEGCIEFVDAIINEPVRISIYGDANLCELLAVSVGYMGHEDVFSLPTLITVDQDAIVKALLKLFIFGEESLSYLEDQYGAVKTITVR